MKRTIASRTGYLLLGVGCLVILSAQPAAAADFYLKASAYDLTLPDTTVVRMWGFASCNSTFLTCGQPSSPGPTLQIPDSEPAPTVLNIQVKNELPASVSLVIPAQLAPLTPVKFTDATGRIRTAALTAETAPGAVGVYTWPSFRPGTFLYHSGSQPQVQVQMGLLGAITYNAGVGQAYSGVGYDSDVLLVYSEIDPVLHAAVANLTYGTAAYPSTFDYKPTYFLVNGLPYAAGQTPLTAGIANTRVLVRLVNGGLLHRAPQILGAYLSFVAENGQPYPYPSQRYGTLLPAGGTMDALFLPSDARAYPLYDRMLHLTSNQVTGGGAYAFLAVTATKSGPGVGAQAPVAGKGAVTTRGAKPVRITKVGLGRTSPSARAAVRVNNTKPEPRQPRLVDPAVMPRMPESVGK